MITKDEINSIPKEEIKQAAKDLCKEDIEKLVSWLSLKENDTRYQSLLLLQERSHIEDDVYAYWDVFEKKLNNENSYQRTIGALPIAENARWDNDQKTDTVIDAYLDLLNDVKPITRRQCIQALAEIIPYQPILHKKIAKALMAIDLMEVKETMRKLILWDTIQILILIKGEIENELIESYISKALSGEILDNKMKKQIENIINEV